MTTHRVASWLVRLAVSTGLFAASGCSSSSSGPSPFNGSWTCMGNTTYTFTMPTGGSPLTVPDAKSTIVFDIDDGAAITFTGTSSGSTVVGDGGSGCSISYDTSGSSATLAADQSCTVTITEGSTVYALDIKYMSGSASVSGTTLTSSQTDSFTGTEMKNGTSTNLQGTISGSKTCTN